ncbi:dihydrodipicolinate synthase family protein [Paenibacillus thalictri]|uniref:N-acetylneuraminate lyase n=1 Tax=Paenibacillus thalictri TaxID=2527873 RepID=A0A4Q9DJ48_9BACL|nr:dihydrodipicolinate synthase family protein [Paenibacillus thalictri]TBL73959.1 N-acetylneuraminate lyase [Paenibacillus thalictri]
MNAQLSRMNGIIPALITPYTNEGKLNKPVTRQLVRHLLSKGVAGFYLSGSTGEGFMQSIDERKAFLELVLSEVKGEAPVIAHIGAMDTATCVELTKHAAEVGADAVSAVAPFYYKHGLEQVKQHYLDIAGAADIPLIIYHFPAMTGVNASASFYKELAQVDNIVGVKFTSMNTFELQQLISACGEDFLVFNGPDEACLAGLTIGCCGAIGSTYNIMPGKFVELYNAFHSGDIAQARKLQYEVNEVIAELLNYDFIAFEREILRLQGFEVGEPRKPIQQLTDEQRRKIRDFAVKFDFLEVK